ncbi:MAG: bacillithiol system redox-active protein YtxJ [Bacteroidia bacterium]
MDWLFLDSEKQISEIIEESFREDISAIAIFKHSTRCSISSMAKQRLERSWDLSPKNSPIYYLDLLAHRDISNLIAEQFSVIHASPQLLLIKNGKCFFNASQQDIRVEDVKSSIQKISN